MPFCLNSNLSTLLVKQVQRHHYFKLFAETSNNEKTEKQSLLYKILTQKKSTQKYLAGKNCKQVKGQVTWHNGISLLCLQMTFWFGIILIFEGVIRTFPMNKELTLTHSFRWQCESFHYSCYLIHHLILVNYNYWLDCGLHVHWIIFSEKGRWTCSFVFHSLLIDVVSVLCSLSIMQFGHGTNMNQNDIPE